MEWLLGVSVVLNIILSLLAGLLVTLKMNAESESTINRGEWQKWEERFYEVQGKLLRDYDLFIAPTMGEFGQMSIKKHKNI